MDNDKAKRDERDRWLGERDVDSEGGPVTVQYYRCPECGSSLVDERSGLYLVDSASKSATAELERQTRLRCDECSLMSGPI